MFYLLIFMLGLAIGSFLNVLIDRLPNEESIMGRSHCDHCKKDLAWNDLIPILSYAYLGSRCRYCGKKLSFFYPMVELITGMAFIFTVTRIGEIGRIEAMGDVGEAILTLHVSVLQMIAILGIVSSSIVIFFSDLKYQIIPDSIQLVLFAFSFLYVITLGITPQIFFDHVVAAFIVMLPILLLFFVTRGKGMGFGDVKLAFSMGFLLGMLSGFTALYIGFASGAVVGVFLILLRKKKLKSKIAFGPFLIIGLLISLFFQQNISSIIKLLYP